MSSAQNNGTPTPPGDYSNLPRGILGRRGIPIARGGRLPSVRAPRDLTLGGAPQKRVFTPNIPVKKEKKEDNVVKEITTKTRDAKRGPRTRGGRGARGGRGRAQSNLIQTQGGAFGEGPMAQLKRGGGGGRYEGAGGREALQMTAPKYTPTGHRTKEEKDDEERMLERLYKDDFIDDLEDKTRKTKPVQLPLMLDDKKIKTEIKKEILPKVKIKKEPKDEVDNEPMDVEDDETYSLGQGLKGLSISEMFSSTNVPEGGNLLLFQFPDCFPGAAGKLEDTNDTRGRNDSKNANSAAASTSSSKDKDKAAASAESSKCSLSDLPEGYIGKLQILKSGACRLALGSVTMDVDLGTDVGFLQQLISVHTNEKEGDLIVLGDVERNLVCRPNMEELLAKQKEPT